MIWIYLAMLSTSGCRMVIEEKIDYNILTVYVKK